MTDKAPKPKLKAPPGSCDTHIHIVGPLARFPIPPEAAIKPPEATLEDADRLPLWSYRAPGVEVRFVGRTPRGVGSELATVLAHLPAAPASAGTVDASCSTPASAGTVDASTVTPASAGSVDASGAAPASTGGETAPSTSFTPPSSFTAAPPAEGARRSGGGVTRCR